MEQSNDEQRISDSKLTPNNQQNCIWVNLSYTHYSIVQKVITELHFQITDSNSKAQLFWYDSGGQLEIASSLESWQFYNHFPSIWSISRKVELAKNIERMQRLLPQIFNFHPKVFLLPGQFSELRSFMLDIPKRNKRTFIIKPDAGSQGKGIILVQNPDVIESYFESSVAQQYISPFLIDGYKFDLRIYVLLTSVDPLRIYIHEEGMARFCTEAYVKPRPSNLDKVYSHLTNYSLNKTNEHFQSPDKFLTEDNEDQNDKGSKRSLSSIYRDIEKMGFSSQELKTKIDNIICLTIGSVQPFLAHSYHTAISENDGKSRCFEILGFDIIIDKHLNPWLLEVNCMPSLSTDSQFDFDLKYSVVKGALQIVSLDPNFKRLVTNRQKQETQQRLTHMKQDFLYTPNPPKSLFNPAKETELAKTTNWRQIYPPLDPSLPINRIMEVVLLKARENPVGAAVETVASRIRKEAVLHQIREKERKKQLEKKKEDNRPPFSTDTTPLPTPKESRGALSGQRKTKVDFLSSIIQKPPKTSTKVKLTNKYSYDPNGYSNAFKSGAGIQINDSEEKNRKEGFYNQKMITKATSVEDTVSKLYKKSLTPSQRKIPPNINHNANENIFTYDNRRSKSHRKEKLPYLGKQPKKPTFYYPGPIS